MTLALIMIYILNIVLIAISWATGGEANFLSSICGWICALLLALRNYRRKN